MRAWGLGVEIFIFFQTLSRRCAFVRGAEGWQKAPWAVQCPFKKMGFGQSPNDPALSRRAVFVVVALGVLDTTNPEFDLSPIPTWEPKPKPVT